MDIHVDIRRFLEIHAWICNGLSDQGSLGVVGFRLASSRWFSSERFDAIEGCATSNIHSVLLFVLGDLSRTHIRMHICCGIFFGIGINFLRDGRVPQGML